MLPDCASWSHVLAGEKLTATFSRLPSCVGVNAAGSFKGSPARIFSPFGAVMGVGSAAARNWEGEP